MAQQEEPLYDFPEPTQPSQRKFLGHQRGQGSLRSISVLDRILLTVPVWLQLSINPATALHILQREPPGVRATHSLSEHTLKHTHTIYLSCLLCPCPTHSPIHSVISFVVLQTFLVRKSRTSQRNVLCVRLADDSVPSFVQQFGITEEQSTLSLETSAISFPDLPRLISFYCVSRDVLPFPLELPAAIAKATSHKELESISHMGIEFWSSHLNVRGPREAPKPQKDEEKKPDAISTAKPAAASQTGSAAQPDSAPQPDSDRLLKTAPESDTTTKQSGHNPTLFHEFCPITTRSPRELDCGSGLGALCFINPLFLQSQSDFSRRRMFKRSLKVRVSTETSTLLSPPLAPPPPPPLMPKTKGKCKGLKRGQAQVLSQATTIDNTVEDSQPQPLKLIQPGGGGVPEMQEQSQAHIEPAQTNSEVRGEKATAPVLKGTPSNDSDYMQPSPMINLSHSPLLSPYLSPSVSPMAPPILPKVSPSISPYDSPGASPSLSPYQSPSLSPRVPFSLSPHDSPSVSPSLSPYQSPSPSPKVPFSLSPFASSTLSQLAEQAYHIPAPPSRSDGQRSGRAVEEEGAAVDENKDEELCKKRQEEEEGLVLHMNAASLSDTDSCSSFSSLEGATETSPHSPHKQDNGKTL